MKRVYLSLLICFAITFSIAQNFSGGFNFFLPPNDSSAQIFLPEFPAEAITDFINIDADGHFSLQDNSIRFWGANLTTGACFPVKDKAAFIAARMRKMGLNLIRFHHMDNPWSGNDGSIFDRSLNHTRSLDPVTLDRLHYLLAQMKRNGVYANINLHVSRTFLEGDGVLQADSIVDFAKAVTFFDPWLIFLQKEYAQQLLSTTNPYTGLPLADDPVMAMVEITNENTLYGFWKGDRLQPFSKGGSILQRHSELLDQKWQTFLLDKYGNQEALESVWNAGATQAGENEQIRDGDFESGNPNQEWEIELHETASATISADPVNAFEGNHAARVDVTSVTGTDWHLQLKQTGLSVQQDSSYVVRIAARADHNRSIGLGVMRDNDPWTYYSGTTLDLTTTWQEYVFTFTAPETNDGQVRLTINFLDEPGTVWFDNLSMADPETIGLEAEESLVFSNIRRLRYSERLLFHPQRVADQAEFYIGIQTDYYNEMYTYLKDTLGVQVPITGSNALVGPADVMSMKDLDYVDDHAYWDHPWFPSEPWSGYDWLIGNSSMLKDPALGTIPAIFGGLAIAGKPYTISEYNHAFPNRFETEMIPTLTAYASLHDTDGLMFFEYNGGSPSDWENDFVDNYFSIHRNNALMGLSPVFAYAYRKKLIEAVAPMTVTYSPEYVFEQIPQQDNYGRWGKFMPYDNQIALTQPIRTEGFSSTEIPDFSQLPEVNSSPFIATGGQIIANPNQGILRINSPSFVSISGFLGEGNIPETGSIKINEGNDFGVLAWLSLTDESLAASDRSLLVLSSKTQNQGMTWDGIQTVHNQWGGAPTEIFPLEVDLELDITADSLRLYPLNPVGKEAGWTTFTPNSNGKFYLNIDQSESQSLWYGIEAFGIVVGEEEAIGNSVDLQIFPNPAKENVQVSFSVIESEWVDLSLWDMNGRQVQSFDKIWVPAGELNLPLRLSGLPGGVYILRLEIGRKMHFKKLIIE